MPTHILPKRKITGYSAILLPFNQSGVVDWDAFCAHVARTAAYGLVPAVNMDTGYGSLINGQTRVEVLRRTQDTLSRGFYTAGAFVGDRPGDTYDRQAYLLQIEHIQTYGGIPTIFQSYGLTGLPPDKLITAYADIGRTIGPFIAFELGSMFAPFGKIYDLAVYEDLLGIRECVGAKHSSLSRRLEWERLELRDRLRPDFKVFSGNDLAIDMVMYGSDYLLGLSTFAPDYFALRDRYWLEGDDRFFELTDILQFLGHFAFRDPIAAYKHSAAQFLKLRGWIACDTTQPACPTRPSSDVEILRGILNSLSKFA